MSNYTKVNHGFLIEGRILSPGQDEINISQYIKSVMVRKKFIEEYFPLFVVNMMLTEEIRDTIRDNDCSLHLRMSYFNIDEDMGIESEDGTHNTEIGKIFDGVIRIYEKPFTTTTHKKNESEEAEEENRASGVPFIPYTIAGIPEALISKNESVVNGIFKHCTLSDVLVHELSSIDRTSQMHIQEVTNKNLYDFVLVPPVSIIPALEFVNNKYPNFYKYGYNLFFDEGHTYFYDPIDGDNTLIGNIFECNIVDSESSLNMDSSQNVMVDADNNMKINYRTPPTFAVTDKISTHALGSHHIQYNYDDNFELITKSHDNSDAYAKNRYEWFVSLGYSEV